MAQQIKKKFIEGLVFTEIDTKIQGAKDYADAQDLIKLQEGKDYADAQDLIKLGEAKDYADGKLVEAKSYADVKKSEAITESEGYADGKLVEAKAYADAQDLLKLQEAKSYADLKKGEAISESEAYADIKKSEAITEAHSYADGVKNDLLGGAGPAYDTLKKLEVALQGEDSAIVALTQTVGANLVEAKGYADAAVLVEKTRAENIEAGLKASVDSQFLGIQDHETRISSLESFDLTVQGLIDTAVLVEKNRAEGVEALKAEIVYVDGQITATKDYADAAVLVEKNRAELAESAINNSISALDTRVTTLEGQEANVQAMIDAAVLVEKTRAEGVEAGLLKLDGSLPMVGDLDLGGHKVKNIENLVVGVPNRIDGMTNSLGTAVVAGPAGFPTNAMRDSTAIFRIVGSQSTNNIQFGMGAGAGNIGWGSWIQSSYDNDTDVNPTSMTIQPLGGSVTIGDVPALGLLNVGGDVAITGHLQMNGNFIRNVLYPELDTDVANKIFVDTMIADEATRAIGVEQSLDGRLLVLEAKTFEKEQFVAAAPLLSISLGHQVVEKSLAVFVGRLALHAGEDYSVSVVDGVTVLTWMGDFMLGGSEAIEAGDKIYVTYYY